MSDDLIAEGRALLAAATPPPWWVGPAGDIFAGDGSGDSPMVAENPGSRDARLMAWAVSNLSALLDALEEAQRPPDGYIVLCKSRLLDGSWRYRTSSSAHHVQTTAEEAAKHRAVSSEERAYVVAEVREVQS